MSDKVIQSRIKYKTFDFFIAKFKQLLTKKHPLQDKKILITQQNIMFQPSSTIRITAQPNGKISKPMLIHINKINFQSLTKHQQIIYYRLPFSFRYQSIEMLVHSDLFLSDCNIAYKIINFVQKTQQIVQGQSQVEYISGTKQIKIINKFKQGVIEIHGTVINEADQCDTFADISLKDIQGYEKYYQYRKKYKTLQNITRKINFSLDHRLKIICQKLLQKKQFYFSLDELKNKQTKNWYIELQQTMKLSFQFQQIVKIGDTNIQKCIQEGSIDVGQLFKSTKVDSSYNLVLEMSQYLKITLSMKIVKNKNLSKFQFVALRVLQTSQKNQTLKIGNEQTINNNSLSSSSAIQIQPLIDGKFYDLQYGYLSQNLNEIKKSGQEQQQQKLYQYLSKLTSSKLKYQHFINQKVIDLSQSKNLIFSLNNKNDFIQIPVTYILEGYNCFSNQSWSIKFLLQVVNIQSEQNNKQLIQLVQQQPIFNKYQPIHKKLFQLKINDMLNIGQLPTIIQNNLLDNERQFYLKIKCQSTIYTIAFQISTVKKSEFKKQMQQLQLKTQYSQFVDGRFVLVRQSENNENLFMIKSLNLQPFYLIQATDTSSISIDISTRKHVLMHGQLAKSQIYHSGSQFDKMVILSPNVNDSSQQKCVISIGFKQIPQHIEGTAFNYKVKYSLTATKLKTFQSVYYGLQILRIQEDDPKKKKRRTDKNKLQQKVQLQVQDSLISSSTSRIKQFPTNRSCFIQKNQHIKLEIRLKRIHYDVDLNTFDNSSLIEKTLLLNRNNNKKDKVNDKGILTFQLPAHHFRQFQFDVYDQQINQKLTLKLQIYCSKQPFSIGDQHVYRIKVPHVLWKMNNLLQYQEKQNYKQKQQPTIQIQTFLSNKNRRTQTKEIIFNSAQEISLPHFNHSDGLSIKIKYSDGFQDIGYGKVRQCIKAKYDIVKDQLCYNDDSEWYLGSITLIKSTFYFFIKMQFDPNAQRQSSNSSRATQKTKSKQKKQTSNQKGGPDIFAKTLKNVDVITKLKLTKNTLNQQLRQLTSKYVQRQSMIIYLKKKIAQIDEQNRRKKQQMQSAVQKSNNTKNTKSKIKNIQNPKNTIYRSVCQCGERDSSIIQWGYCVKCIEKLRQKYETFFKEYQQTSLEYEKAMFKKFSLRDKIDKLKQKIEGYRNIIKGTDQTEITGSTPLQIQAVYERMQQKQLALELQQLKLEVFDLERERQSEFERRSYQMNQMQRKIKKEEDELWQKSQQLNALHLKLKQIQQQIKLNQKSRNDNFD